MLLNYKVVLITGLKVASALHIVYLCCILYRKRIDMGACF